MSESTGRATLRAVAPEQATVFERLEGAAWQAMARLDRVDLFDLAARAVAGQHRLPGLTRPEALGASPFSAADAAGWRSATGQDEHRRAALALAEQLAFDVASVQPEHRTAIFQALGDDAAPFTQAVYVADLVPRARAGLDALFGASDWSASPGASSSSAAEGDAEPGDLNAVIEDLLRLVPGLQALDAVTTELVRLLGARRHACRICQSVRSWSAMAEGADDAMFDAVDRYASSDFTAPQKAALAFVDGMISSPARFEAAVVEELGKHFDAAGRVELVLDVTRNATNKVAVALGGDAPRVEEGYEVYDVKPNGDIVYGLEAP